MSNSRATIGRLLARAAELRAGGSSWEQVAAAVGRAGATCQRWPRSHPDLWRRLYRAAEQQLIAEIGAESLRVLRAQLRSKDDKTRRDAAKTLAGMYLRARRSYRARRPAAPPSDPLTDVEKAMTHEHIQALTEAFGIASAAGGPAAAIDGGGAAQPP